MEDDPFANRTYSARAGAIFRGDGRVDLRARSYRGDTALDGFGLEDLNAMAATDEDTVALTVEKNLASFWRQTFRLGETQSDVVGTDPDTVWNNYRIRSEITQVDLQSDVTLSPAHVLNFGLSTETRGGVSAGNFDEEEELDSWFVQDQWSIADAVHVTAAVRRDDHSAFGAKTSHRFTLSSGFGQGRSRIHASYGTAFRAPNLNELYFPLSGDPGLLPETTEGLDVGFEHRVGDSGLSFDLTWFEIAFDQLIEFDLATRTFGNVAEADSSGVEATLRYRPTLDYRFEVSHTYNETKSRVTGNPLARRPRNRSTLAAWFQPTERLSAALTIAAVSDRTDGSDLALDDYTQVHLHLAYAWSLLQPFVRFENLLDEEYFEVPGYVTPRRTVVVGVRLRRAG